MRKQQDQAVRPGELLDLLVLKKPPNEEDDSAVDDSQGDIPEQQPNTNLKSKKVKNTKAKKQKDVPCISE
jgi:hypothetical protein